MTTSPSSFCGTWTIDHVQSDSIEPMLEAWGVSWMIRRAAAKSAITQTITLTNQDFVVKNKTALGETSMKHVLDAGTIEIVGPKGEVTLDNTQFHVEKEFPLQIEAILPPPKGGRTRDERQIDGNGNMIQILTYFFPDGVDKPAIRMRRVWLPVGGKSTTIQPAPHQEQISKEIIEPEPQTPPPPPPPSAFPSIPEWISISICLLFFSLSSWWLPALVMSVIAFMVRVFGLPPYTTLQSINVMDNIDTIECFPVPQFGKGSWWLMYLVPVLFACLDNRATDSYGVVALVVSCALVLRKFTVVVIPSQLSPTLAIETVIVGVTCAYIVWFDGVMDGLVVVCLYVLMMIRTSSSPPPPSTPDKRTTTTIPTSVRVTGFRTSANQSHIEYEIIVTHKDCQPPCYMVYKRYRDLRAMRDVVAPKSSFPGKRWGNAPLGQEAAKQRGKELDMFFVTLLRDQEDCIQHPVFRRVLEMDESHHNDDAASNASALMELSAAMTYVQEAARVGEKKSPPNGWRLMDATWMWMFSWWWLPNMKVYCGEENDGQHVQIKKTFLVHDSIENVLVAAKEGRLQQQCNRRRNTPLLYRTMRKFQAPIITSQEDQHVWVNENDEYDDAGMIHIRHIVMAPVIPFLGAAATTTREAIVACGQIFDDCTGVVSWVETTFDGQSSMQLIQGFVLVPVNITDDGESSDGCLVTSVRRESIPPGLLWMNHNMLVGCMF